MNNVDGYYEILGLKAGATLAEIKDAYRDLVKVWHPDRFAHDPKLQLKAQEKLKEINHAYQMVIDFVNASHAETDESDRANAKQSTKSDNEGYETSSKYPPQPPRDDRMEYEAGFQVPRPWVRFWARTLDLLLFSLLSGLFLAFVLLIAGSSPPNFIEMPIISAFFLLPVIVIIEALILATFGNTPGKAILKTKITNENGKDLSFAEALKRGIYVYFAGYAVGFFPIAWVMYLWQYRKLKLNGKTSWDEHFGFNIYHSNIGGARITSYVILYSLCLMILGMANSERSSKKASYNKTSKNQTTAYPQIAWKDILSDPAFQREPQAVKEEVARNYFEANIESDPEFQALPKERKERIYNNFMATVKPFDPKTLTEIKNNGFGKRNGKISVFTEYAYGTTNVYIDDIYMGELNLHFPPNISDPICGQEGTISKELEAGSHRVFAENSDGSFWQGTVNIKEGECRSVRLYNTINDLKNDKYSKERNLDKRVTKPKAERRVIATVNKDLVFVYEKHYVGSKAVKSLNKGDKVQIQAEVLREGDVWCAITEDGQESTGFVLCEDLDRPK